jgi:PAS domain S-box-containing protein
LSFWVRLFLTFTLCLLFTLLLLGAYVYFAISSNIAERLTIDAFTLKAWVKYDISNGLADSSLADLEIYLTEKYSKTIPMFLVDEDGILFETNRPSGIHPINDYPELEATWNGEEDNSIRMIDGRLYVVVASPIIHEDDHVASLVINYPADALVNQIRELIQLIIATFVTALIIGAIVIYFTTRYQTKPLLELIDDARAISAGDFERKFTLLGNDEISQLSRALQIMVTRLKAALTVAQEEKSRFNAIFTHMMDGLIVADIDGRLVHANASFLTMFGLSLPELIGFDVRQCNLPVQMKESILSAEGETVLTIDKPSKRVIRVRTTAIEGERELVGSITICEDISREKELEASEREFTQYISHELKTPLTSLSAAVETLQLIPDDDKKNKKRFLAILLDDIGRLNNLVTSIIEFQKNRNVAFELQRFGAVDLAIEIQDKYLAYAFKKGVNLDINIPDDEVKVVANRDRIVQVMMNVTDNAIRFTPKGGRIVIGVKPGENRVLFWIEDSGIGIPNNYIPKLGERFIKIPRKEHKYDTQVGLGLSICIDILNQHGSKLEIESEEGKGSRFSFYLKKG